MVRVLLGTIVVAASGIYAYVEMFSQFQFYDDEGFLMAFLKSFVDGAALYEREPTFYGPFYYLVAKYLYFLADVPVSHDASRLATIAFWLGTAALSAGFVYRLTSSFTWTTVAYLQTMLHGWGLCREPGHPQTLLVFLGMAAPFASAVLGPTRTGSVILGVVAACIALTKSNVGVYTLVALMVVYLRLSGSTRWRRAGALTLSVVAAALPFVLMRSHLSEWALNYAWTSAITIAACCVTIAGRDVTSRLPKSAVWVFIASGIAAAVVVVSLILLEQTSLQALVTGILLAPARFPSLFVVAWRVSTVAVAVGVVSLALAVLFTRLDRPRRAALAVFVKLTFGATAVLIPLWDRSALIAIAPLMWVTLISPHDEPSRGETLFPRAVVCLLAALYPLIAYPVAGSQQDWATMLLIPAAIINLADAGSVLSSRLHPGVRTATQATLLTIIVLTYFAIFYPARLLDRYSTLTPLNLYGATRIRLDAQHVTVYQDLVKAIDDNCETFATVPNFMSLYFWTRKTPPDGFNRAWITLVDHDTQRRLVRTLAANPSACVVYNQSAADTWASRSGINASPLISYIRQSFRTVRTIGDYELLVRNERAGRFPE